MAEKRKIAVLVINRANYGRLKPVIAAIATHPDLELQLIVGSSMLLYRFGDDVRYVEQDGFPIAARLNMILEGGTPTTMAQSAGMGLLTLPPVLEQLKPDVFLVNADRFEVLPAAMAAAYMNIPVAHTLGGEVTGTIDESVRHAVTKLAHLHFVAHPKAAERVVAMGEHPEDVFIVGNPSLDIARSLVERPLTTELSRLETGVGAPIDLEKPYILAYQHPVTTEHTDADRQITETLRALEDVGMQIVMLWPNPDAGSDLLSKTMRTFREQGPRTPIHFLRSLGAEEYLHLLKHAACVVGNSSSAIMEGGFFGTPAVNVGTRQAGRERCRNVVDVGYDRTSIATAIRAQLAHGRHEPDYLFGDGRSGARIAAILADHRMAIQKQFNGLRNHYAVRNLVS